MDSRLLTSGMTEGEKAGMTEKRVDVTERGGGAGRMGCRKNGLCLPSVITDVFIRESILISVIPRR